MLYSVTLLMDDGSTYKLARWFFSKESALGFFDEISTFLRVDEENGEEVFVRTNKIKEVRIKRGD